MSLFSSELQHIIAAHSWTQMDAATAFGLSQGAVSNYLKGRSPAAQVLEAICRPLPDEEKATLLTAHLRDGLPSIYRDLVLITPAITPRLREEAEDSWRSTRLPAHVKRAVDLIVQEAIRDQVVQDWVTASAAVIAPNVHRLMADAPDDINQSSLTAQ